MRGPTIALIVPLGQGPIDPGFGNIGGIGGVDPGYGRPIFHPGHPDHGLPSSPGHPGNRPPGSGGGGHIDNELPEGGEDISNELPIPPPPPDYSDDLVIAIHKPGATEWEVKAYEQGTGPDNTLPPTPEPKSAPRRGR